MATPQTPAPTKALPATPRTPAPQDATSGATIRVRATQVGYYGDARRRVGDVFTLRARRGVFTELVLDKDGEPKLNAGPGFQGRITKEVTKTLTAEQQFSPRWMEKVSASTPERTTTPNEDLARKHDEEMQARHTPGMQTEPDNPTGAGNPLGDD